VWPLSRRPSQLVRVCRDGVELWQREGDGLASVARHGMTSATPAALSEVLVALPSTVDADVVVESAWMPVVPLEAGTALWSQRQMSALFEHRLAQTYGSENDAVAAWQRRLDYRPGDAHGIGYAMPPSLKAALAQVAKERGHRWRSLQPAFNWGWRHHAARRRQAASRGRPACWVWLEQDRALVAMTIDGHVSAMNPGADLPADDSALKRLAAREAARFGIEAGDIALVSAGWSA